LENWKSLSDLKFWSAPTVEVAGRNLALPWSKLEFVANSGALCARLKALNHGFAKLTDAKEASLSKPESREDGRETSKDRKDDPGDQPCGVLGGLRIAFLHPANSVFLRL
jgi:hypothetical protein